MFCAVLATTLWVEPGAGQTTPSILDGVFTEVQAQRGEQIYEAVCASCHEPTEFVGPYFQSKWDGRSVGGLYILLRTTMPSGNPNSLAPGDYSAVIAYILRSNQYPAGSEELPSSPGPLNRIEFIARATVQ